MPPALTRFVGKMSDGAKTFTPAHKAIAMIGVAVLVMGGIFLTNWMTKPSMTPLFSGLSAEDANTIVEQLRGEGVEYELTGGGGTILVPEESVYDQRMKAAAAGVPSNTGTGYNLLDDMGVTSSEFQQSVAYKRALEGELAATIGGLDGVKTASVRLAMPEETVFVKEAAAPTASVFISTDPGQTLSSDQVQAIVHLTSSSIEGMTPENVAVIDAAGTVLSSVGGLLAGGSNKAASDYEQRISSAVQTMLDRVVGPGNATVAVAAEMSDESAERTEEVFTAAEDVPALNETTSTEEYVGSGGPAAGVLGPDNIAVPNDADNGEGNYQSENTTRNNAVNKSTETTSIPAGTLTRQTVSVALNEAAAGDLDEGALEALVINAAGINEERGDAVSLEVVPFNTAGAEEAAAALEAAEAAAADEARQEMIRNAVIGLGILVLLIVGLVIYAIRNRRQRRELIDLGERLDPVPFTNPAPIMPAPIVTDTTSIPVVEPLPELHSADVRRAAVKAMAETNPEKTAEYMRSMMDERVGA